MTHLTRRTAAWARFPQRQLHPRRPERDRISNQNSAANRFAPKDFHMTPHSSARKKVVAGDKKAGLVYIEVAAISERNTHPPQQLRIVRSGESTSSLLARRRSDINVYKKKEGRCGGELVDSK